MNTKQITAANVDELMEQREQSQACLGYAESRQKKTEGQKIMQLYETAFPENEQIPWKELMHVQMTVQGLGFKQSSDTFIPGSESEHRWQDEHPDRTFINK
jgi:hypothetical protein